MPALLTRMSTGFSHRAVEPLLDDRALGRRRRGRRAIHLHTVSTRSRGSRRRFTAPVPRDEEVVALGREVLREGGTESCCHRDNCSGHNRKRYEKLLKRR